MDLITFIFQRIAAPNSLGKLVLDRNDPKLSLFYAKKLNSRQFTQEEWKFKQDTNTDFL